MYAPPEQFGGSPATPASDVYAATATFYECLTGRPPFTGDTAERLLYQHLSQPVALEPVPEPLRPLVAAGLAKDPASRPADGTTLVAELRAVAGGAYGPGWEDRGRSGLAAAALLLAALWPSGGPAAVQGSTVHRISLRRHLKPRHVSPAKTAIAAGVAVAVAAAVVVATHTRPARPAVPVTISGSLMGVADTSASSAWAVGCSGTKCTKTLILHWNGATCDIPAVAAASDGSAWAVGCTGCTGTSALTTGRTVILRWNGTAWSRVPSPSPGLDAQLLGVTATSADSAWAVGYTSVISNNGGAFPLILRWNGVTWTQVPNPGPEQGYLDGVAAVSARSVWAFGVTERPGASSTLIMHWNGTTWTRVPSPSPGTDSQITGLAAASDGSAWAVGNTFSRTSTTSPLILHWNGTAWTLVPNPSPAGSFLDSVATASDGSAWAVGYTGTGTSVRMLMLRWNGTAWTRVPSPYPGPGAALSGATALSGSDVWAVGGTRTSALILRWNGQMWSATVGSLSPAAAPASSPASTVVSSPAPSGVSSPVSSPAPAAVSSPALPARRQAAQALAVLLAQSGTDRAAVTQAVNAVADCSPGLSRDETIFSTAASSRQVLLGKLAALPDRSALPASMLQDLTTAWQASGQADQDFAGWTQDEISRGCSTKLPGRNSARCPGYEGQEGVRRVVDGDRERVRPAALSVQPDLSPSMVRLVPLPIRWRYQSGGGTGAAARCRSQQFLFD